MAYRALYDLTLPCTLFLLAPCTQVVHLCSIPQNPQMCSHLRASVLAVSLASGALPPGSPQGWLLVITQVSVQISPP